MPGDGRGIFRGPAHDRRAALAAGPDVWEIVARLQDLDGSEEQRITPLTTESDLNPRLIRIALDSGAGANLPPRGASRGRR
jgi:hypothetical protein